METVRQLLEKQAGSAPLEFGGALSSALIATPGGLRAGDLFNGIGDLYGLLKKEPEEDQDEKNIDFASRNAAMSLIPGFGGWRMGRRSRGIAEESKRDSSKHPYANLIAEQLGRITSALGSTGLGALAGTGLSNLSRSTNKLQGAVVGGGVGLLASILANIGGAAKAGTTPRRTREEQSERDDSASRVLLKYLVPGVSTYDSFKRLGRSRDWDDKARRRADKERRRLNALTS